jgi:hypothetical protein
MNTNRIAETYLYLKNRGWINFSNGIYIEYELILIQ